MTTKQTIGHKIYTARKAKGLTQTELAQHLGKLKSSISSYETGVSTIPTDELPTLAKALGVSIEYFFEDDDIKLDTHTRLSLGLAIHARHAHPDYDHPRISTELERVTIADSPIFGTQSNIRNIAYLWSGTRVTQIALYGLPYTEAEITELLALGWILDTEEDTFKFKLSCIDK